MAVAHSALNHKKQPTDGGESERPGAEGEDKRVKGRQSALTLPTIDCLGATLQAKHKDKRASKKAEQEKMEEHGSMFTLDQLLMARGRKLEAGSSSLCSSYPLHFSLSFL